MLANAHNKLLAPKLVTHRVYQPVLVLWKPFPGPDHHLLIPHHFKDTYHTLATRILNLQKAIVTIKHLTSLYTKLIWISKLRQVKLQVMLKFSMSKMKFLTWKKSNVHLLSIPQVHQMALFKDQDADDFKKHLLHLLLI